MSVTLDSLEVKVRNFPLPVVSMKSLAVSGRSLIIQRKKADMFVGTPREGLELGSFSRGLGTSEESIVRIGNLHTVVVKRTIIPMEVFYDVDGVVEAPCISFSPAYLYSLRDVVFAVARSLPPMMDPREYNHWHLVKALSRGHASMSISDTRLILLTERSPFETSKYMQISVEKTAFAFSGGLANFELDHIHIIQKPAQSGQGNLVEVPKMSIFTSLEWVCVGKGDNPETHRCAVNVCLSATLPKVTSDSGDVLPVAVNLHSGTLANLLKFITVYTSMPPVPFPPVDRVYPTLQRDLSSKLGYGRIFLQDDPHHVQQERKERVAKSLYRSASFISNFEGPDENKSSWADVNSLLVLGVFVERFVVENAHTTVWEGKHLGPARGLRFIVSTAYFSAELHEEEKNLTLGQDSLVSPRTPRTPHDQTPLSGLGSSDDERNRHSSNSFGEASPEEEKKKADLDDYAPLKRTASRMIPDVVSAAPPGTFEAMFERGSSKIFIPVPFGVGVFGRSANTRILDVHKVSPSRLGVSKDESESKERIRDLPLLNIPPVESIDSENGLGSSSPGGTFTGSSDDVSGGISGDRIQHTWSVANLRAGVIGLQGLLVHNQKWKELADQDIDEELEEIMAQDRVVVHMYENERLIRGLGWSKNYLLPTDRDPFTDRNGKKIPPDAVRLPSDDWMWTGDWQLDFKLRRAGEVDEEGWEFANDFPRKYSARFRWFHNVRRRRWIRIRRLKKRAHGNTEDAENMRRKRSPDNFVMSMKKLIIEQQFCDSRNIRHRAAFLNAINSFMEWRARKAVMVPSASAILSISTSGVSDISSLSTSDSVAAASTASSNSRLQRLASLTTYANLDDTVDKGESTDELSLLEHFRIIPSPQKGIRTINNRSSSRTSFDDSNVHLTGSAHIGAEEEKKHAREERAASPDPGSRSSAVSTSSVGQRRKSQDRLIDGEHVKVHTVLVYEPKVLITVEIRNALYTLADSYVGAIWQLVEESKPIPPPNHNEELSPSSPVATAASSESITGSNSFYTPRSPHTSSNNEPHFPHTPHTPAQWSTMESGSGFRARESLLSPSTLSFSERSNTHKRTASTMEDLLTLEEDGDANGEENEEDGYRIEARESSVHSLSQIPETDETEVETESNTEAVQIDSNGGGDAGDKESTDVKVATGSGQSSTNDTAESLVDSAVEVQNLFSVQVFDPQINVVSDEKRGQIVFTVRLFQVEGRLFWSSVDPNVFHREMYEYEDGISFREKFELSLLLDESVAYVAPTDVDLDAGATWLGEEGQGVLKPVCEPVPVMITAVYRPHLSDPCYHTSAAGTASMLDRMMTSDRKRSLLNRLTLQFPLIQLRLDSHQFAILLDVLEILLSSPLPSENDTESLENDNGGDSDDSDSEDSEAEDEICRKRYMSRQSAQLELTQKLQHTRRRRLELEWSMRNAEWLLLGVYGEGDSSDDVSGSDLDEMSASSSPYHDNGHGSGTSGAFARLGTELSEHQKLLKETMAQYASVSEELALLIRTMKRKGVEIDPTAVVQHLRSIHLEFFMESMSLECFKLEESFFILQLDGIASALTIFGDLTGELTVEVRYISAIDEEAASHDPQSKAYRWKHVVAPLLYGNRIWNHKNVMFSLHGLMKTDHGTHAFPHLELNLYPLNVRLTYELASSLFEFFVTAESTKSKKRYDKYKGRFVPKSRVILTLEDDVKSSKDTSDLHSRAMKMHTELEEQELPSRYAAGDEDDDEEERLEKAIREKKLFVMAMQMYKEQGKEEETVARVGASPKKEARKAKKKKRKDKEKERDRDCQANMVSSGTVASRIFLADMEFLFTYVRIGSTRVVVSYKGDKQNNVEDFEGLKIKLNGMVYQRRLWTLMQFGKRLQTDIVRDLLSQVGDTIGALLSYKMGWRGHMKRRARNEVSNEFDRDASRGANPLHRAGDGYEMSMDDLLAIEESNTPQDPEEEESAFKQFLFGKKNEKKNRKEKKMDKPVRASSSLDLFAVKDQPYKPNTKSSTPR